MDSAPGTKHGPVQVSAPTLRDVLIVLGATGASGAASLYASNTDLAVMEARFDALDRAQTAQAEQVSEIQGDIKGTATAVTILTADRFTRKDAEAMEERWKRDINMWDTKLDDMSSRLNVLERAHPELFLPGRRR